MAALYPAKSIPRLTRIGRKRMIRVENVPKTATRDDLLRMIERSNTPHVVQAQIDYHRFLPNGNATITLADSQHMTDALISLRRASISQYFLHFKPIHANPVMRSRNRGIKGRQEASLRETLVGDGPDAGIPERGKAVVIWGLPVHFSLDSLGKMLEPFEDCGRQQEITTAKIECPEGMKTSVGMALVRLKNTTQAHRLVRHVHRQHFNPDRFQDRFEMRARVVY